MDKILKDNINKKDIILPHRIKSKQGNIKTKIIGLDTLTKEVLFESTNQIVLGGAMFILEKLFNVEAPITVDYLNNIMGIAAENPIEEKYPKNTAVCLFGVGIGGCGDSSLSVVDVNFYEREIFDMVPFRVTDDELNEEDQKKYWFKRKESDGRTSYFLKTFEQDPVIKVLWKDGDEDEDGSEVSSGVHDTQRTEPIETFIELILKITKKDVREYFEINGNIEEARINSIGLFTGIKQPMSDGSKDYKQVKLFSKLNIPNEMLVMNKDMTIIYRIYTS